MKRLFMLIILVNALIFVRMAYLQNDSYADPEDYIDAESSCLKVLDRREARIIEYRQTMRMRERETATVSSEILGGEAVVNGGDSEEQIYIPVVGDDGTVAGVAARPTLPGNEPSLQADRGDALDRQIAELIPISPATNNDSSVEEAVEEEPLLIQETPRRK